MFRRPPAAARPFAARVAPWLVALALLLRLLLPALHHHHAHHGRGPAHGAAVEVCSCGQVHERAPAPTPGDGEANPAQAPAPHFCLACEVDLGTPGACAGLPPSLPTPLATATRIAGHHQRLAAVAADRRPPTRAPPARSC